jgi:hypothetical protein
MQLMQLYVQKSTKTTLPFRSDSLIGFVLIYPEIFVNSGAGLNCDLSIRMFANPVTLLTEIFVGMKLVCCWLATVLFGEILLK